MKIRVNLRSYKSPRGGHPMISVKIGGEEYKVHIGNMKTLAMIHILERYGEPVELRLGDEYVASFNLQEDAANIVKAIVLSPRMNRRVFEDPRSVLEDVEEYGKSSISRDKDGIHIDVFDDGSSIVLRYFDSKNKIEVELSQKRSIHSWATVKEFLASPRKYICDSIKRRTFYFRRDGERIIVTSLSIGDGTPVSGELREALLYAIRNRITLEEAILML